MVLYVVSGMVKRLADDVRSGNGEVKQLFVFTHNVFFHKEASFIDGRTKELSDVHYWIVRKDRNVSSIKGYGKQNPINTTYGLMWKELKDGGASSVVTVQNIMRRIIEYYFMFLGSKPMDTIKDNFQDAQDKMILDTLAYWINDGSHSIPDDVCMINDESTVAKYMEVFHEIFTSTGNGAHYDMMMGEYSE